MNDPSGRTQCDARNPGQQKKKQQTLCRNFDLFSQNPKIIPAAAAAAMIAIGWIFGL